MNIISDIFFSPYSFLIYGLLPFMIGHYILLAGGSFAYFYILRKQHFNHKKIQEKIPSKQEIFHEILWSFKAFLVWIPIGAYVTLATTRGWNLFYFEVSTYGIAYFLISIILLVFLHDMYFYWTHRFMHSSTKLFKFFHETHHKSDNPTPFAVYSFSPAEALLLGLFFPLVLTLIPIHLYALLIWFLFEATVNCIGHLGYELLPKKVIETPWGKLLNTEIHHNMHHQSPVYNFGHYFNIWDSIMKTNNPDYHKAVETFYKKR